MTPATELEQLDFSIRNTEISIEDWKKPEDIDEKPTLDEIALEADLLGGEVIFAREKLDEDAGIVRQRPRRKAKTGHDEPVKRRHSRFHETNKQIAKQFEAGDSISSLAAQYKRSTRRIKDILIEMRVSDQDINPVLHRWREDVDLVRGVINQKTNLFFTASFIKNSLASRKVISKKRVCRILRYLKYRFVNNHETFSQKHKKKRPVDVAEVEDIRKVATVTILGFRNIVDLYFLDEFKIVCPQNALRVWKPTDQKGFLERDVSTQDTVTCIMVCSLNNIEAYQLFGKELRG